MTYVVGITARKGTGKSTLAAMLKEEIEGAKIIALADALRSYVLYICCDAFDSRDGAALETWLEAHKATVYGPLLQGFGEMYRQLVGQNYWIDELEEEVESRAPTVAIIPDVRYENEAEWIKAQGGLLIALEGPSRWEGDQRDEKHPSEAGVELCRKHADACIPNNRSLENLRMYAQIIARDVKNKMEAPCQAQD